MEIYAFVVGKCCYYWLDGEYKKCKYLVVFKDGKAKCKVYPTRLTRIIDTSKDKEPRVKCTLRILSEVNYEGCPYNQEDWKDAEVP